VTGGGVRWYRALGRLGILPEVFELDADEARDEFEGSPAAEADSEPAARGEEDPGGAGRGGPSQDAPSTVRASGGKRGRGRTKGKKKRQAPRRGRWSQAEINRLREAYGLRDDATIARELNRPVASIRKMAETVFDGKQRTGPWTAQEVQNLKRYLGISTAEVIGRILGRRVDEVRRQIEDLGRIQNTGRWSRDEVVQLKRIYGTRSDEDLARVFGRSVDSVKRQAAKLALAKDKAYLRRVHGRSATRMPRWSDDELARLEELYQSTPNLEIARDLGRSVKSVVSKAHALGLKKDPERLRAMGRENVSCRYRHKGGGRPPRGE